MKKVKVDVTKLPNYASLSEEAKKALADLEVEVDEPDYSGYVKKDVFDKKASEAADLSKQLKSKMSETELAEAESRKVVDDLRTELAALKKEKTISSYKAEYLGLGYSDELAVASAEALASGDMAKVFANQKQFIEQQKKNATAAALNQQPTLTAGQPLQPSSPEDVLLGKIKAEIGLK